MCVNGRFITNKYTGNKFFVKCGHCKACQQEKALKATNRIRREFSPNKIALFVTLTYDRLACPYVDYEQLRNHDTLIHVKREYDVHINARTGKFKRRYHKDGVVLDSVPIPDSKYYVGFVPWLKHRPQKVGVCYYKDLQDFVKRLRINCNRSYIYHEGFKLFGCSEYGPSTKRPHFHLLLFIRPEDEAFYRSAILKAWPFAHQHRTERYIELAREPASYVASYVNCRQNLSSFLANYFAPKHSYSKYFGFGDENFTLDSILSKVNKGSLRYNISRYQSGVPEDVDILIPVYVINRYFPKFKGYSRFTCNEVSHVLLTVGKCLPCYDYARQHELPQYRKKIGYDVGSLYCYNNFGAGKSFLYRVYSKESDYYRIMVRLRHAFDYYHAVTGLSIYDYAIDYERTWRCYKSNVYRDLMENEQMVQHEKYVNLSDIVIERCHDPYWISYIRRLHPPLVPNDFIYNRCITSRLSRCFDLYDKNRKVTNFVMSQSGHYV